MKKLFVLLFLFALPFLAFAEFEESPSADTLSSGTADATYLRLDVTNDPLTDFLEIEVDKAYAEFDSGGANRGFNGWDTLDNHYGLFYSSRVISFGNGFFAFRPSSTEWEMEGSLVIRNGGRIFVPDGSDALPAYSYDDDGDTGWRRLGANTQAVIAGGAQSVIIDDLNVRCILPLQVGATAAFNPAFTVISTTKSSHPFSSMTTTQRNAISTPESGDGIDNTTTAQWERFNGTTWDAMFAPTIKAGSVAGASFAGNPKIFTVTFNTAFPDANYAPNFLGSVSRNWTVDSILAGSFVINTNSNTQPTGNIGWTAIAHNDP